MSLDGFQPQADAAPEPSGEEAELTENGYAALVELSFDRARKELPPDAPKDVVQERSTRIAHRLWGALFL